VVRMDWSHTLKSKVYVSILYLAVVVGTVVKLKMQSLYMPTNRSVCRWLIIAITPLVGCHYFGPRARLHHFTIR